MAVEQKKGRGGAGASKPGANSPGPSSTRRPSKPPTAKSAAAKDASRAQSRPVTGQKLPSKGGNTPRPGSKAKPAPTPRGMSGTLIAWGAVGLVIVVIVVLIIVKATNGSSGSNAAYTPVTPAPASVVKDVTGIPASVFDKVGVNIPSVATPNPPIVLKHQPPLSLGGHSPAMFYYGAEYCPYCAAERWAMTVALSRFGTWRNLDVTASSHTDVYPATPTFSYRNVTFISRYLRFVPVESCTNIPDAAAVSCSGYKPLQNLTKAEQAVINKYASPTYIPGATAGQVGFPFVDINNVALISGASYSPQMLAGLDHSEIAGNLNNPSNSITQAIVGSANYISAAICVGTKQQPSSVCQSSGVQAAAKALKLS
ncbi:MAG: DUF929 family protein [Acidimicrobiales bacterium]